MKIRIISGLIAGALLFFIVWAKPFVMGLSVCILSIVALYEFYQSVSRKGHKPLRMIGFITCIALLIYSFLPTLYEMGGVFQSISELSHNRLFLMLIFYIMIIYFFGVMTFRHDKYTLNDIAITLLGILYIPFLFSFVIFLRNMENGFYYVWLIFLGAWGTDIFAYFTGRFFGKRKILPVISPNKTVEGSIGGIIGCCILTILYGIFYINKFSSEPIMFIHYVILGLINGFISQMGDWAASAIKRSTGVKDYGNIIPGHGGILDRFDSLLFVAPTVYFYIEIIVKAF